MEDPLGDGSFIDFDKLSDDEKETLVNRLLREGKLNRNKARELLGYPELDLGFSTHPFVVPPKQTDKFEGFCETCKHCVYVSGGVVSHNESCSCDHKGITFHQTISFDDEINSQVRIKSVSITEAGKGMGEIRTTSSTGAEKGVKPERYDLIPIEAMAIVARLYGKGAEKYAAHNWRKGYEWSKSYSAMQRHGTQFWGGEDIDEEMGLPHLAGVVFHALSLMTFMIEHPEFDDRYKVEPKKDVGDAYLSWYETRKDVIEQMNAGVITKEELKQRSDEAHGENGIPKVNLEEFVKEFEDFKSQKTTFTGQETCPVCSQINCNMIEHKYPNSLIKD